MNDGSDVWEHPSAIALIAMAGRFPGARDVRAFHQNLAQGVESISRLTDDELRRQGVEDAVLRDPHYVKAAAPLAEVDSFDAAFFNYSARDAEILDPQHRLFLECAWEALEAAGYGGEPGSAARRGRSIGVFAAAGPVTGSYLLSNVQRSSANAPPETRVLVNNDKDYISTRVSYKLNLSGPSLTIQTACSSSLVAVHVACQSLLNGECDMALAGGASIRFPHNVGYFYQEGEMFAPDGHCRAFDQKSQGTIFGSGVGVVLLKPLAAAIAAGDPVIAVIRGTALSNDGGDKISYWATSATGQLAAMSAALAVADVPPETIGYVETHGTATELGDPVEIFALGRAYPMHDKQVCAIGSVKTNIGHAESAAGVIGLIKAALSLKHKVIYPSLHFVTPNPRIDFANSPFYVNTTLRDWAAAAWPRRAAVNSLGIGGTNAHVILEEAPADQAPSKSGQVVEVNGRRSHHILTLSARTPAALQAMAERYRTYLRETPEPAFADVCYTAATRRTHFEHRLALVAADAQEAARALAAFPEMPAARIGRTVPGKQPSVAFLFTGQGAQYVGMGRALYETEPTFRKALQRCDELLRPYLDRALLDLLYSDGDTERERALSQTVYTQPALFALEYSLACLWRSFGIQPSTVMGYSVGELAAACVAGVFSLEDGLRLIAARGRLMQALPAAGAMYAVWAGAESLQEVLTPYADRVAIAGFNGPHQLTISGERTALQAIVRVLSERQIQTKELDVSHAFHSPLMEPMLDDFAQVARTVRFASPQVTLISNFTGAAAGAEIGTPEYWVDHVRQAVRFATGMDTLRAGGYDALVEIGPKPVLLGMARQCLEADVITEQPALLASLRAGSADWQVLLESLGELHVRGAAIDWKALAPAGPGRLAELPTYPFQRTRYSTSLIAGGPSGQAAAVRRSGAETRHPLLGRQLHSPLSAAQFETVVGMTEPAYLAAHRINGKAVFPASAYYEMALAAGAIVCGTESLLLRDVELRQTLLLPATGSVTLQSILSPAGQESEFQIYSLTRSSGDDGGTPGLDARSGAPQWTLHATGRIERAGSALSPPDVEAPPTADGWVPLNPGACSGPVEDTCAPRITQLGRKQAALRGQMEVPAALIEGEHRLHPQLLTSCLDLLALLLAEDAEHRYVQAGVERLHLLGRPTGRLQFTLRLHPGPEEGTAASLSRKADLSLNDADGQPVAVLTGIRVQRIERWRLGAQESWRSWLCAVKWLRTPRAEDAPWALPALAELAAELAGEEVAPGFLQAQREAVAALEQLSVLYIGAAFTQLGWRPPAGQRVTAAQLVADLQIRPPLVALARRLLEILASADVLRKDGAAWEVRASALPEPAKPAEIERSMAAQAPAVAAELALLTRCGAGLAGVLRGDVEPLELLFPNGDLTIATNIYRDSAILRRVHGRAQQVLGALQRQLPQRRTLRILEVGGGTGGMTAYLLPQLAPERTEYVFTDIGPTFLLQAQERFAAYPFVRVQTLDIEKDPAAQGFAGQQYDIVIAANVLHATQDLRTTLAHVRGLLGPGGMLLLVEGTARQAWIDLVFGITEGWWRFTDKDLRPDHPLLDAQQWIKLLAQQGFTGATDLAAKIGNGESALIVAQVTGATAGADGFRPVETGRRWLLLTHPGGVGEALAARLRARGDACTLAYLGPAYDRTETDTVYLTDCRADLQRLLAEIGAVHGVVHDWQGAALGDAATAQELDAAVAPGCRSALHLTQALIGLPQPPRLWFVVADAHALAEQDERVRLAAAPLCGFYRSIALEHPELRSTLIDIETKEADAPERILAELLLPAPGDEGLLAFRRGQRYVARLESRVPAAQRELVVRGDATYLITGGLGGLGLATARWLVAQGARHLVLLGRRAPDAATRAELRGLASAGAQVVTVQADVAERAQLAAVLADIAGRLPPLRGVFHTAGVFADRLLRDHDWASFTSVFPPKVAGAWNLHCLTAGLALDCFVLYSAGAALFGEPGLSNYVAANAFLDGLAHYRRQQRLPALSVNWGPWHKTGMADAVGIGRARQWEQAGIRQMEPADALAALGALMRGADAQAGVLAADWPTFVAQPVRAGQHRFFSLLGSALEAPERPTAATGFGFRQQLAGVPGPQQRERLRRHVQKHLTEVLRIPDSERPDFQQGFTDLGLDSLLALELRNRLQASLECRLPWTLTFKYPRLDALASYLADEVLELAAPARPGSVPSPLKSASEGAASAPIIDAAAAELLAGAELDASLAAELVGLEALLREGSA